MANDEETLLSMGFDPARVQWALKATSRRGLQPALDHIVEHENDPVPSNDQPAAGSSSANKEEEEDEDTVMGGTADLEAKSIRCSQCGKVFRNTALANFHAEKSGHDQFEESTEEIKPLTEEEVKARLGELQTRMAEKRARKAEEDLREQKANVLLQKKAVKDVGQIKEDMKLKQAMRDAEQKKRDKIADAKAKAAVKAQIEADKRERAERAARDKALREGKPVPDPISISARSNSDSNGGTTTSPAAASSSSSATTTTTTTTSSPTKAGRDFKETRLQIRMASGGKPYLLTLSSDATLREVAEYVASQSPDVDVETVTVSQHFPRVTFAKTDFSRTLRDLGLTPSAVLLAS